MYKTTTLTLKICCLGLLFSFCPARATIPSKTIHLTKHFFNICSRNPKKKPTWLKWAIGTVVSVTVGTAAGNTGTAAEDTQTTGVGGQDTRPTVGKKKPPVGDTKKTVQDTRPPAGNTKTTTRNTGLAAVAILGAAAGAILGAAAGAIFGFGDTIPIIGGAMGGALGVVLGKVVATGTPGAAHPAAG